jgi:ketosteroid isomerase-like protein
MPIDWSEPMVTRAEVEGFLAAFAAKNLEAVMAHFAEDAVFYDPHYPQPRMVGRVAIAQGMQWGMSSLEKPGFTLRHLWVDGNSAVVEVDTHHVIRGALETRFDQVFVMELRDGKLTRLQTYVPYGPHGMGGLVTAVTRLVWRLQGKL